MLDPHPCSGSISNSVDVYCRPGDSEVEARERRGQDEGSEVLRPRRQSPQTQGTVCPRSSDPFYIVSYYIKWVTTSWTC